MRLFDIYYDDKSFDQSAPLPKEPTTGTLYAVCTNWDAIYLIPDGSDWLEVNMIEAIEAKEGR